MNHGRELDHPMVPTERSECTDAVEVVRSDALPARKFIVSSTPSDSHTWNLVFLQLLLEERGSEVINLGSCVPLDHLVEKCLEYRPDVLVLSSVNGHGHMEGAEAIRAIRKLPELDGMHAVIGGKLGVLGPGNARFSDQLIDAGFDAVFHADASAMDAFMAYLDGRSTSALEVSGR